MNASTVRKSDDSSLCLRPAAQVMDLERLGRLHPWRLSFMRTLMRRVVQQRWRIETRVFDLDANGYGTAVYEIETPNETFSFVVFAHELNPARRSDRVIADAWDMTVTLCAGRVDANRLARLAANVPAQEKGRLDASCIVLSRANKSARNFEAVIAALAAGRQPSPDAIERVGYLYRTTAVYGSGKFGMAEWQKINSAHPDFARPFAAEMFTCWMIRQFSLEQADWIAQKRAPATAVAMDSALRRCFGIGNATGLGMAPYLLNHPLLIGRWIEAREIALARVLRDGVADSAQRERLRALLERARNHFGQIHTGNEEQDAANAALRGELKSIGKWLAEWNAGTGGWEELCELVRETVNVEAQELLYSLLIEIHPALVDDLEDRLCEVERYALDAGMTLECLRGLIETHYGWALATDFAAEGATDVFWYRSEEKSEPRLGLRGVQDGEDRAIDIGVARSVCQCYAALRPAADAQPQRSVASFLFVHPGLRALVRRVQAMSATRYGEIRANLLDRAVLPMHLLRCKLSFFGVGKFDPRSRLWVRNTMFQGAPLREDIGDAFEDDWIFPVLTSVTTVRR